MSPVYKFSNAGGFTSKQRYTSMLAGNPVASDIPLTDLYFWYDAADSSTVTVSGGKITQWADKSGNNLHATQGTGALQPTYSSSTQNSKNVVTFSGGQYLIANISVTSNVFTHFLVYRKTSTNSSSTYSRALSLWKAPNGGDFDSTDSYETHLSEVSFNGVTAPLIGGYRNSAAIASIAITANTPYIYHCTLNGSAYAIQNASNTSSGTTSATSLNSDRLTVGAGGSTGGSDAFMIGWFAESIFYKRVLSAGEITQVRNYLSAKWGI